MASNPATAANYTKAFILSRRVVSRLESLDTDSFPTPQTQSACSFLKEALEAVVSSSELEDKDPINVHSFVTIIHQLVDGIDESCGGRMAWPVTYFCDGIWSKLFPTGSPKLFYVHAPEYNYFVMPFTSGVVHEIENVLAPESGETLLRNYPLWALALPSIEDRNLPLYANIVHEFGHVLFTEMEAELDSVWDRAFAETISELSAKVSLKPTLDDTRVTGRINQILRALAQEAFSDLLASLVMGPAFYLSLYETLWPDEPGVWTASLTETETDISAHPAPAFRLSYIRNKARIDTLVSEATTKLHAGKQDDLVRIINAFDLPKTMTAEGRFAASPLDDVDAPRISTLLSGQIRAIEASLNRFLEETEPILRSRYAATDILVSVSPGDVCSLVDRLENNIIPNIVPNETLLGRPARFVEILAAAAADRLFFLTSRKRPLSDRDVQDLDRIERLTAKALEATFVQAGYNQARGRAAKS